MTFDDDREETGWRLHPLNGETGHSYMGVKGNQKMFFKRNMTPFTAALSTEHIAPRLVWTKRLSNGDILTAQEWSDGRTLERHEMGNERVIKVLQHVHSSERLLHILEQIGGKKYQPAELLNSWIEGIPKELFDKPIVRESYEILALNQPDTKSEDLRVCHGDLNHRNWLLADDENLYLVDWDKALITDPLYDIGSMFTQYIPKENQIEWLKNYYGEYIDQNTLDKCEWYKKFSILKRAKDYALQNDTDRVEKCIAKLKA